MRALLDVNMLVALLDPEHIKHVAAYDWFDANLAMGWASCPLTENGCLRVMTNPWYTTPKSPAETLARLKRSKDSGNHAFWPDDVSITDTAMFDWNRVTLGKDPETGSILAAPRDPCPPGNCRAPPTRREATWAGSYRSHHRPN